MRKKALPPVNISEMGGVRYLHLGTEWVQGSMWIDKPFKIELDYVQRMMAWLLFFEPSEVKKCHAMQLGLGSGAISKACYKTLKTQTTVLEINPAVVAACQQWFKLPSEDKRFRILLGDALDTLQKWELLSHDLRAKTADFPIEIDAIQVDLYDHHAAAPVLDSADFYALVRDRLSAQGVLTVNLFGREASFEKSLAKICHAFGEAAVWQFKPTKEGNTVVLAQRLASRPKREIFALRAAQIESQFDLPAGKWLRLLKPLVKV